MKKGIVVVGMMLMSAVSVLYAGENPRNSLPVKESVTMVSSEPVLAIENWMLEIFPPAIAEVETVPVESWMLCPAIFNAEISNETPQELESWMLGEYFTGLPVSDKEESMTLEPWMLNTNWM